MILPPLSTLFNITIFSFTETSLLVPPNAVASVLPLGAYNIRAPIRQVQTDSYPSSKAVTKDLLGNGCIAGHYNRLKYKREKHYKQECFQYLRLSERFPSKNRE